MIEVYCKIYGKNKRLATFDTYEELFRRVRESDLAHFGYNDEERTYGRFLFNEYSDWLALIATHRNKYTVLEDGAFVTPDRLVGFYRAMRGGWKYGYRYRGKKHAYGGHRRVRTTQERKLSLYCDDEYTVKIRGARNMKNLVNSWDDIISHNDKSWKTQSRRKHQWKAK